MHPSHLPPAVTGSFRDGNLIGGHATYVAYAVGMGLVIAVLAVGLAFALALDGAVHKLRNVLPHLNRIAGGLLILTGAYVTDYGYFGIHTLHGDRVAAGPVDGVTNWSANLSARLDNIGALAVVIELAVLAGIGLPARRRHTTTTPPTDQATTTIPARGD